jgi:hypothetical protein
MRRFAVTLLLTATAAACGVLVAAPDEDAATAQPDASDAVSGADAGAEASSDAVPVADAFGPDDGGCAVPGQHAFCADFNESTLAARWDGFTDNGQLSLDPAVQAAHMQIPLSQMANGSALTTTLHIAAPALQDVKIAHKLSLSAVGTSNDKLDYFSTSVNGALIAFRIQVATGVPTLQILSGAGNYTSIRGLALDQLHTIVVDANLGLDSVTVSIDGSTAVSLSSLGVQPPPATVIVELGTLATISGPWDAHVDDVIVDVQ